ncbi:hypothetical protein ACFS27_02250 [Promicromonospora vindobonensis]|uniref:Formate hydrogenlyase regulatory protein HycA n=1 Tax=Promicromonospora vindobonensis TaxID=195748 RepID=A0ABW5VMC9_9MICO
MPVMPVPDLIPIAHEPDYRTATIGRYDGGQFFASLTYAFRDGYNVTWGDWQDHKLAFAVLHRFDHDGHYVESEILTGGTVREERDGVTVAPEPEEWLADRLDALPGREFGTIAIRPFQTTHDGILFGLVLERHGESAGADDWAELYPDHLGFHEPWDGLYDT